MSIGHRARSERNRHGSHRPASPSRRPVVDRLEQRVLLAGNVDSTFGVQVTTDFGLRGDVAQGVAQQPDGKLIVVGYSMPAVSNETVLAMARYNADGTLDASFGNGVNVTNGFVTVVGGGGKVTLDYNDPLRGPAGVNGFRPAVQNDGKIVVSVGIGGAALGGVPALARFNADGSPDTTFDGDGLAAVRNSPTDTHLINERFPDLALVNDAAGNTTGYVISATQEITQKDAEGRVIPNTDDLNWVLVKYTASGQPDPTFGDGGRVVTDFAGGGFTDPATGGPVIDPVTGAPRSWEDSWAIQVLPDGKILQAGGTEVLRRDPTVPAGEINKKFRNAVTFARFNADGSPDATFGGTRYFRAYDGSVTSAAGQAGRTVIEFVQKPQGPGEEDTWWTKPFANIKGMTTDGTGRILATGAENFRVAAASENKDASRILVYRLSPGGALDNTFAGDGIFEGLPAGGRTNPQDEPTAIVHRNDRVIVVGKTGQGPVLRAPGEFLVLQLNPDGTPDAAFDGDGAKTLTAGAAIGRFNAAMIQSDGKLVAVGQSGQGVEMTSDDFAVGRFNADGSLDAGFGRDNAVVPDMTVLHTAVQPDGKILAAGYRGSMAAGTARAVVARYLPDGGPDRDFAPVPDEFQGRVGMVGNLFAVAGSVAHAVARGPDGSVFVAGVSAGKLAVAKLTPGGARDTSFDPGDDDPATPANEANGVRLYDFGDAGGAEAGYGITVLDDGSLIVTGESDGLWTVAKLRPDGSPDASFARQGVYQHQAAFFSTGTAAAVTPIPVSGGEILVAGTFDNGSGRQIVLMRFRPDGSHVLPFPGGGFGLFTGLTTGAGADDPLNKLDARSVAVDADGNVIVAGAAGNDAGVARFTPDGLADPEFGTEGRATFDWGGVDDPDAVIVGEGGTIYLVGTRDGSAADGTVVAAVNPEGTARTDYGTNGVLPLAAADAQGLPRFLRSGEAARRAHASMQGNRIVVNTNAQQGAADQSRRSALQRVLAPATPENPDGPELSVSFARPVSGSFLGGARVPMAVAVSNGGFLAANSTPVTLYLSSDGVVDGADRELATGVLRRPLKEGKTARLNFGRLALPSDLPAGQYHVLAMADAPNATVEVDEDNNVADGGTITLGPPVTDAVPVSLTGVRILRGRGTATLLVRNDGNSPLRALSVVLRASADDVLDGGDALLGQLSVKANIKPGATKRVRVRFANTAETTGNFTLIAVVDAATDPTAGQAVSSPATAG